MIIWKQILDYSKSNKKDIIFITNDQKEDWWEKTNGKTIGPRYELKKEFTEITSKKFLMYTMENFLQYYNEYNNNMVDQVSIDEVKNINHISYRDNMKEEYQKRNIELRHAILKCQGEMYKIESDYEDLNTSPYSVQNRYSDLNDKIKKLHSELKTVEISYEAFLDKMDIKIKNAYSHSQKE